MVEIIRNLRDPRQVKFIEDTINATTIKITLTDKEIIEIYNEHRKQIMTDWMRTLIEEYEYPEQDEETLQDMAENFMDRMQNGDRLGEVEHETFESMMEFDYPEIKVEEDEDNE